MAEINGWREVVNIPVIAKYVAEWNLDELEKILTRAISACARKNMEMNGGQICTTLSGGLDSSFCLAKMRKIVGPQVSIHTFTVGGSEGNPDVQFARKVARYFSNFHHELIPSRKVIEDARQELCCLWENETLSLGDEAIFLLYEQISRDGFKSVIAHDGIDELLGGYWEHRKHDGDTLAKETVFKDLWARLEKEHLLPLEKKAGHFGITVLFPYLQESIVEYVSRIPLDDRTSHGESKIPLRTIARKYLPKEIILRRKKGFCSALEEQ